MSDIPKYYEQTIKIESEIFKIIEDVNPVYRVAMINMALKTFINTDTFKYYFNTNNDISINNDPGIMNTPVVSQNITQSTQQVVQNSVQTSKPTTSWDDF